MAQFNTNFLSLGLTDMTEMNMTFLEWRTLINGVGNDSNMELIDNAIAALNEKTDGKADGLILESATGLLQLTHNGEPIEGASVILDLNNYYTKPETDKLLQELQDAMDVMREDIEQIEAGATLTNLDEVSF